jgi:hypothetical protein
MADMILNKIRKPKPIPTEWTRKFAWLPVRTISGELVWLETVLFRMNIDNYYPEIEYSRTPLWWE